MKTINIKGKEYVPVNERVKYFRENFKDHKLINKIIKMEAGEIIIECQVLNEKNEIISIGIAHEKENSSFINKTSYIENCETSAVGRALGFLNIGITTSIATAEEVQNAIKNQEDKKPESKNNDSEEITERKTQIMNILYARNITQKDDINKYINRNLKELGIIKKATHLNLSELEKLLMKIKKGD